MNALVTSALVAALVGLPVGAAVGQQPPPPAQPQPVQPAPSPPSSSPTGSPANQAGGVQAGVTIASDSLIGTKVRDAQGKDIGHISKLLIDAKQGRVAAAIIRQGGTLGMGSKELSVPWEALTLQHGQDQQLVVTMQQPLLERAPSQQSDRERQQAPAASPATSGQQERKP